MKDFIEGFIRDLVLIIIGVILGYITWGRPKEKIQMNCHCTKTYQQL